MNTHTVADRRDCLDTLRRARVIAVVRAPDAQTAIDAGVALHSGGIDAIEVTFTVPDAPVAIRELRDRLPHAVVGAGTLRDLTQVHAAVAAGAAFLVSPGTTRELQDALLDQAPLAVPGVATVSEAMAAIEHGAIVVKWFPAASLGPAGLRTILGPLPDLAVVPTGGVAASDAAAWLDAGAVAVGLGSDLCDPVAVRNHDQATLRGRAHRILRSLDPV